MIIKLCFTQNKRIFLHMNEEEETMPRPRGSRNKKSMTIDEQINAARERVEALKNELAEAEAELKTLTALRDEESMKELMATIASSGKSVNDVIAMIKSE